MLWKQKKQHRIIVVRFSIILFLVDNTLTVMEPDYVKDTGVYKCHARNAGNGESEASIAITVHSDNDTTYYGKFV